MLGKDLEGRGIGSAVTTCSCSCSSCACCGRAQRCTAAPLPPSLPPKRPPRRRARPGPPRRPCVVQRGDGSAAVDAKKKEFEVKRAAQAAKAEKVFFKVTVRVSGPRVTVRCRLLALVFLLLPPRCRQLLLALPPRLALLPRLLLVALQLPMVPDPAQPCHRHPSLPPPFRLPALQDNGMGMSHKDIPEMLGRVLSGTKWVEGTG